MTKCHCDKCSSEPLETYQERFRYTSECKWTAKHFYRNRRDFEKHMEGIVKNRGEAAAMKLRKGVIYLWEKVK